MTTITAFFRMVHFISDEPAEHLELKEGNVKQKFDVREVPGCGHFLLERTYDGKVWRGSKISIVSPSGGAIALGSVQPENRHIVVPPKDEKMGIWTSGFKQAVLAQAAVTIIKPTPSHRPFAGVHP
jgi:hypothetical protein